MLSVTLGNGVSYASWKAFFLDLRGRDLKDPLLIVVDGCQGALRTIEEIFPDVEVQRWTKHRMENVLEKVLKEVHAEVKHDLKVCLLCYT